MEKKREEPGKMQDTQGGTSKAGEPHKRIRSLSVEVPGTEAMLCDPGEPHKCVVEEHSPGPEDQQVEATGPEQKPGEPPPGWQEHPILGKEAVSTQNEKEERQRRKMEQERSGKKKPAA